MFITKSFIYEKDPAVKMQIVFLSHEHSFQIKGKLEDITSEILYGKDFQHVATIRAVLHSDGYYRQVIRDSKGMLLFDWDYPFSLQDDALEECRNTFKKLFLENITGE